MQPALLKQISRGPKSWSFLYMADTCHLQLWFKYGERIPEGRNEWMDFGSAFHDFRFRYYDHCRRHDTDSDYGVIPDIARTVFHDKGLPLHHWDEFSALCRKFAENRPFNPNMRFELRFGINRDESVADFDRCDGFRGIVDGIEIADEIGVVTDAKTSRTMEIPPTQIEVYAAFFALKYPEVKEWRLVYDFIRFGKTRTFTLLADNAAEMRNHVWTRIENLEKMSRFEPQPGEHCLQCPYFTICDYRLQGVSAPKDEDDVRSMIEDYFVSKVRAERLKKIIKTWCSTFGDVEAEKTVAGFFMKDKKIPDKEGLTKFLKKIGKDPMDFLDYMAKSLTKLMKDQEISDDVGNYITIEQVPKFEIKKKKKGDGDSDEEETEGKEDS